MDIKSPVKYKAIVNRIFAANVATLGITTVTIFLAFVLVAPLYFENKAREEMTAAGKSILNTLDQMHDLGQDAYGSAEKRVHLLRLIQEIKVSGKAINARMVLTDEEGVIRLSSFSGLEKNAFDEIIRQLDSGTSKYQYVRIPFVSEETGTGGYLYLFAESDDIGNLNRDMLKILAGSLVFGTFISLMQSLWLQQGIGKPMKTLMQAVERFSVGEFAGVEITTRDEFQKLSEAFNRMAHRLKSAEEAQIRMIQDISHELKTPLMSVQGYAEAIRDGIVTDAEAERSLDVIIEESQRLKRLVEDLLTLSKLENQEFHMNLAPVAGSEIAGATIHAVGGYAREHGITVELRIDGDFQGLMDFDRMKQCLINIIGNGIRYSESKISVTVSQSRDCGLFIISDDGVGIGTDEIPLIFNRFHRGKSGGAGMGLTIAQAIAQRHGGDITASNGEVKGAVFQVSIPLIAVDQ